MSTKALVFYEKVGCIGNRRQKQRLQDAGVLLVIRNLLREDWTAERLRPFFADKPVCEWFNKTAPAVKSGEVVPEQLGEAEALAVMRRDPVLIRRPLLQADGKQTSGFEPDVLRSLWGIDLDVDLRTAELESCPKVAAEAAKAAGEGAL